MSFLVSIATGIFTDIVNWGKEKVVKHFFYMFGMDNIVAGLETDMNDLRRQREDVEGKIKKEESQGMEATKEADGWREDVKAIENGVKEISRLHHQAKPNCRGCSFSGMSNYSIGKRATELHLEVKKLKEKRKELGEITTEKPMPAVKLIPTISPTTTAAEVLKSKLEEALVFLTDDTKGILGISGVGGVGKSTLLESINNSMKDANELKFDHVIFVTASQRCTVEKLQERIIKKMKLRDGGDEANTTIYNFLAGRNFLLLLDDVWEALDLKEVGIPQQLGVVDQCRRKVIIASRDEAILGRMEASIMIRVNCLNWDQSWDLFQEKVGKQLIDSHPRIQPLARELAEKCAGLPLALIILGRAMSRKKAAEEWRYVIDELNKSRPLASVTDNLFPVLKLSYDNLEEGDRNYRECFLHCTLWPEDFQISKDDLVECWLGHGLIDIDRFSNIVEAYNEGYFIIGRLQEACLLDEVELESEDKASGRVKMHDLIREMALQIVCDRGERWITAAPHISKDWKMANKISLIRNSNFEVPSDISICSNLTTLILRGQTTGVFDAEPFKEMGSTSNSIFPAVRYLDLSYCQIDSVPAEICKMVELQYLNLSNTLIEALPEELKNLKKLKYLILQYTRISSVPPGLMESLENLQVFDVFTTEFTMVNQTPIIDQLICFKGCLKAVGINVSSVSDLQKISSVPIRSLFIKFLEGCSYKTLLSPKYLGTEHTLKKLHIREDFRILEPEELVIEESCSLHSLESLSLRNLMRLKDIIFRGIMPENMLATLRDIRIISCSQLENITWVVHLPCLELLVIAECENMTQLIKEEVAAEIEPERSTVFPCLRYLGLISLPELGSICDRPVPFASLGFLFVSKCPKLKKLPFQVNGFPKLEMIVGEKDWWESLEWEDENIPASILFCPW